MARIFRRRCVVLCLFAAAALSAQTASTRDAVPITLGHAVAPLYRGWKFTVGDSPIDPKTGQPLWAEPNFDDSHWENVDLTPQEGSENPVVGTSGYVPGWTAKGHPGYWGFAWYRIRVRIDAPPNVQLALAGPAQVDDAYQFFDNGTLAGSFGDFSPTGAAIYYSQPLMFRLRQPPGAPAGVSPHVFAFRMWMQPQSLFQPTQAGGFETAPWIGEAAAVAAQHQVLFDELIRAYLWQPLVAVVFGLLGLIALSLMLADRSDHVYVWIGALLLMMAVDAFSGTLSVWTFWVHARYDQVSHDIVLFSLQYAGWVMVWRAWFRQRRPAWMPWSLIPLVLILMIARALSENLFFVVVSDPVINAAQAVSLIVRLVMTGFLFFIVARGIREEGAEGWLVLPAVLLAAAAEFARELNKMGLPQNWFPFHVQVTLQVASELLLVVVLTVLLVRRLVLSLRRQRQMALDVKQAQVVQRVILPEAHTTLPGLVIESEYRPAREVGGDFFQVIPLPDSGLLIVTGDVAGKGLQAGMLVALLVGAIRMAAELSANPAFVIQALNRRLMGRGDAGATCLALHMTRDGFITLANAGHVPPYLNGEPVAIAGSLPLGVIEPLECSTLEFRMAESDRLLLLSDGVAEAMNVEGELYGFDRVLDLLRSRPSAADIADTAQAFGQHDDISVISVTRVPVTEPALVP